LYTYAQAETVLARMYDADPTAQAGAFRGRLKHLKRLGVPLERPTGRGRKVPFDLDHLYQWTLCLELSEFGLDPTLIVRFVRHFWPSMKSAFDRAASADTNVNLTLLINPVVMSKTWWRDPGDEPLRSQYSEFLDFSICGDVPEAANLVERLEAGRRRAMVINLSEVVRLIATESRNIGVTG
jgi:hypothetical protein